MRGLELKNGMLLDGSAIFNVQRPSLVPGSCSSWCHAPASDGGGRKNGSVKRPYQKM